MASWKLNLVTLLIVLFGAFFPSGDCGSLLFYMPLVSRSMKITFMPLAEAMAERGHEVVVVMPHPSKKPHPKVKEIIVDATGFEAFTAKASKESLQAGASTVPPIMEFFNVAADVRSTSK